jgi:dihydrofolate reductase
MAGVDAPVMGRKSFDTVLGFDPWPYPCTPVHVLTLQPALAALGTAGVRPVNLDGG